MKKQLGKLKMPSKAMKEAAAPASDELALEAGEEEMEEPAMDDEALVGEEEAMEMESPKPASSPLAKVSDDELLAEMKKRGLSMGGAADEADEFSLEA